MEFILQKACGEDGRNLPFPAERHLQLPYPAQWEDEENKIRDGIEYCRGKNTCSRIDTSTRDRGVPDLFTRNTFKDAEGHANDVEHDRKYGKCANNPINSASNGRKDVGKLNENCELKEAHDRAVEYTCDVGSLGLCKCLSAFFPFVLWESPARIARIVPS